MSLVLNVVKKLYPIFSRYQWIKAFERLDQALVSKKATYFIICIAGLSAASALGQAAPDTATGGVPNVMDQFQAVTSQVGAKMSSVAGGMLGMFAAIQVTWNACDRMMKGGTNEIAGIWANLLRSGIIAAFFFWLIGHAQTIFPWLISQWEAIGAQAIGSAPLTPGGMMGMGISVVESMRQSVSDKVGLIDQATMGIFIALIYLITLFSFFILAGQMALAQIRAFLGYCIWPLLLGFGGLKSTREIAMNALKANIPAGVIIVTVYIIAAIANKMVPYWSQCLEQFSINDMRPLFAILVSAALVGVSAWQVPKLANDFINGSVSGGISEIASMAVTAAAAGAAMASGGAAALGVGGRALESGAGSVKGALDAGAAGLASAGDHGKSGLGAVAHAAGQVVGGVASTAGQSMKDYGSQALEGLKSKADTSIGGKAAEFIESKRGGSVSPSGSSNVGTGAESASSPSASSSGSSNANNPLSGGGGNASNAAIQGDGGGPGGSGGGAAKPAMHERIRDLHGFIPEGGSDSVHAGLQNTGMSEPE